MDAAQLIAQMAERGDLIGLAIAVSVALLAFYFRSFPFSGSVKSDAQMAGVSKIATKVADIDQRLSRVEMHVDDLPTRSEFHEVDVRMVRLDERIKSIEATSNSTARSVHRIEEYLISLGTGK